MNERFAMCSTAKFLVVASVLQRVDHQQDNLARLIDVPAQPLLSHSPLTAIHAGDAMTVSELCFAALTQSDNTAANLLLASLAPSGLQGGPAALTHFARAIGDEISRLDRPETSLNEAAPGDPRDTTTPAAMADNLRRVLLGTVLSSQARAQLAAWMVANQTGADRLRSAFPTMRVADKTGSNGETTSNDIAVIWPAQRAPVIVTAYLTECPGQETDRARVLAQVGRITARAFDLV